MLKIIIIAIATWALGVFGFSQVIGSIQNFKQRGAAASIITISIWIIILGAGYYTVNKYFSSSIVGLYIGYGVSLINVFMSGKIS
jgi:uncharacterized membrane protein YidH (DUF202 family)